MRTPDFQRSPCGNSRVKISIFRVITYKLWKSFLQRKLTLESKLFITYHNWPIIISTVVNPGVGGGGKEGNILTGMFE